MIDRLYNDNWKTFIQGAIAEAEARGYRRGVEDARKAIIGTLDAARTSNSDIREGYELAKAAVRVAIDRMPEQTSDTNSPHPENGTGLKSET
jgi:hypothetical protein